jgi:tRNA A-37 threonylcarbamoyl transferase component Bud32
VSDAALLREAGAAGRLTVSSAWREPVAKLGLLEPGALERWLGGAGSAGEGRAAAASGAALRRFHDAGGRHADLHVKNLLLRETRAGAEVIVIDLDRGAAGTPAAPARRARELGRLWRSLVKRGVAERVGWRGVAAFLAAYCAGDRALRDALARRLPAERRRAARHALLYRR